MAAVVGVAVTAALGNWQLSRAVYKDQQQARVETQRLLAPLPTGAVLSDAALDRRVQLSGHWLAQATIYLENRPMNGQAGFVVLTPLRQDDGAVVLVQRGWAPRNLMDRTALPPIATPAGTVVVQGRITPPPSDFLQLQAPQQGPIRQNLDLDAYRTQTQLALPDVVVLQTGAASDGLLRDWPPAAAGSDKNRGYAFQWFGMAALIVILYVWFQIVRRFLPSHQSR